MSADARIGLEVHVQLDTVTKLFCGDRASAGGDPNTRVCPVCLGLPGALPVVNRHAIELAVRAALGLGCTVHEWSVFARKSYFYPDLPRGYQITQSDHPLASGGSFEGIRIRRLHIEEDAGRLLHDRFPGLTAIDYNRAGAPLVEIVTEPDIESPAAARLFLQRLRRLLRFLEVSDCEMENGSLRADANVSVHAGDVTAGPLTELKNLNSFAHLEHALHYEIDRLRTLDVDERTPETRGWDEQRKCTVSLRTKETWHDYRYQPEPDLPPVRVDASLRIDIAGAMPELPDVVAARFATAYDLPPAHVEALTAEPSLSAYYEALARLCGARAAASWVLSDVLGWLNRHGSSVDSVPVTPGALAELIELERAGRVSRSGARRAFVIMAEQGGTAAEVVARHDLGQVRDDRTLLQWIDPVLEAYPDVSERCRKGEQKLLTFLVGQVMRASEGRADPKRVGELLQERLSP